MVEKNKKGKFIRPPFKIHGGKRYLAPWVIENLPDNYEELDYIEPYCGAASVFMNKLPGKEECINDINKGVIVIMKSIRDCHEKFIKELKKIKYKKENFEKAQSQTNFASDFDLAINEFILRRMSRGGLKKSFAWSNRTRGGKPGDVNAWETIIKQIPNIANRIKQCFILNKPALEVIQAWNNENVLCYCDPTYLKDTRVSKDTYDNEMNIDDHIDLSDILLKFKGKVIISGYSSNLYNRIYRDWNCKIKKIANHSSQQKIKPIKTECIWCNF